MQTSLFSSSHPRRSHAARKVGDVREWWPITVGSVLLAIDPSIANCGWAIVQKTGSDPIRIDSGTFHPRGDDDRSRFDSLGGFIASKCHAGVGARGVEYTPTDALIEIPSGGQRDQRSATQLMVYARAVGICEAACYLGGLSVNRVPVNAWKSNQKKARTLAIVRGLMRYQPRDDNECDALGMALWLCAQRNPAT